MAKGVWPSLRAHKGVLWHGTLERLASESLRRQIHSVLGKMRHGQKFLYYASWAVNRDPTSPMNTHVYIPHTEFDHGSHLYLKYTLYRRQSRRPWYFQ